MEAVHEDTVKKAWDRWGIALSSACIIHCVAVVVLPLLVPAVGLVLHGPWVHRVFAVFIAVSGWFAFSPVYRRHGLNAVVGRALAGTLLLVFALLFDGHAPEGLVHGLSIAGSILLVIAHVLNLRHTHQRSCC